MNDWIPWIAGGLLALTLVNILLAVQIFRRLAGFERRLRRPAEEIPLAQLVDRHIPGTPGRPEETDPESDR